MSVPGTIFARATSFSNSLGLIPVGAERMRPSNARIRSRSSSSGRGSPSARYNGLDDSEMAGITMATGTSIDDVRYAHKADLADWASEQQLRDHPDMALAPRPRSGAAPTNPL
ncbi:MULTISPECIES: hypothetical protein [unclassified Streptomyces]|uniref:hypothetical protein n=1 Tax=unclassified Streptomyces TaxID=2593676 RepID=UPI00225390EC|nr:MULTISPECIES: hypothetical protein [unclassified Streptomyces]MCX5097988.1 hypothetical protein [Streptomyces sp. NBC_00439]MCX5434479.1 hypothetical protein [Streptomyces sp. NBC_00062]WTB60253.1 hypothetical protein OG832_45025 [Streptomyces sp. NBC_00826]WTB60550.1 hypothetical protein OG832_46875 [Streptomyces sp. NBC_00826]